MTSPDPHPDPPPPVGLQIGEGFEGQAPNLAHVNTVVGPRTGGAGTAFATALASPSAGHTPFLVVARPGVPVQPPTLFVNKATIAGDQHATLTWGAAQAGVAAGVRDAVAAGSLDPADLGQLVVIAAVWVDPSASDAEAVFANNRRATATALDAGARGLPAWPQVDIAGDDPWNPSFRPR